MYCCSAIDAMIPATLPRRRKAYVLHKKEHPVNRRCQTERKQARALWRGERKQGETGNAKKKCKRHRQHRTQRVPVSRGKPIVDL